MINHTITEENKGKRADVFASSLYPDLSRSFVQHLLENGRIQINKQIVKAGYKLKTGDVLISEYDESKSKDVPKIDLPIIYEDDDCIVINKPIGVLTHSKGVFNPEGTVATFAQSKVKGLTGERAGIVHRLDRATSGVVIVAKTPEALSWLQKQFSQRKVKKIYMAVVEGVPEPQGAIIDMPIERNPKKPQTFRVGPNGKSAVTAYEIVKSGEKYSLLKLVPTTGRTHQLRVHLKHLGYPIVGDTFYEGEPADRLYLHALSLEITLPDKSRKVFEAPMPKEFKKFS